MMARLATISLRPRYLGRAAWAVGGLAACVVIAVLATARAARNEEPVAAAPVAVADDADGHVDEAWRIPAERIERVGYRQGRRHVIDVVPLGPDAVEVEINTARAFVAMRAAAARAGVELRLESGFRTAEEQRALFQAWRKGRGNKAARPGQSNHQSGRALDIAVISSPGAREWLEANAMAFGFKRTVKSEPWHWEYIEVPVARGAAKRVTRKAGKSGRVVGVRHAGRRPIKATKATAKKRMTASRQ